MSRWSKACLLRDEDSVPHRPGVYVIYIYDRPVYVGQSSNLALRLRSYKFRYGYNRNIKTPWGDFHDEAPVYCKFKTTRRLGDWLMWEYRLIQKLQPEHNKVSKKVLQYG